MNKISRAALFIALLACIGLIATYLVTQFRYAFSSDDAIRSVLVEIANARHRFMVTDWVYANGDLFLATPYSVNLIVSHFVQDSFLANAISSFIGYLFLLGCFYKFCTSVEWKYPEIPLLSTVFLASGISAANLEFSIAQGIYSTYSGFALLAASLLITRPTLTRVTKLALASCVVLAAILAISNPKRTLVQFVLPLLIAWVFTAVVKGQARSVKSVARTLFLGPVSYVLVGYIVGSVFFYVFLLPKVMNFDSAVNMASLSPMESIRRMLVMPKAWIEYLQPQVDSRQFIGLQIAVKYAAGLIAIGLVIGPLAALLGLRKMSTGKCFILAFGLIQCAISMSAMVTKQNLFIGYGEMRYLTIGMLCFIPFFLEAAGRLAQQLHVLRSTAFVFLVYALTISSLWAWPGRTVEAVQSAAYKQRIEMVDTLKSNGVCVALASYWRAYVNTVAGNFGVMFYPVEVSGFVRAQPHHSYRGPALSACERSALLLTDSESTPALREMIQLQFGKNVSELRIGEYQVMIFDKDIYAQLLRDKDMLAMLVDSSVPKESILVSLSKARFDRCLAKSGCSEEVSVTNLGSAALSSFGSLPVRLGIHGLDRDSQLIENDAGRIDFPIPLKPGSTQTIRFNLPYSEGAVDKYELCVIQEGVGWRCDRTRSSPAG